MAFSVCLVSAQEVAKTPQIDLDTTTSPIELNAGIAVVEGYTNNVFSTENNKKDDFVTVIIPTIELSVETEKTNFVFGADAEIGRYNDYTSEDYNDGLLRAEGEFKLSPTMKIFGGGDFAWEHEDRSTIDNYNGSEPTKYTVGSGFAGLSGRFEDITLRFGGNLLSYNYDDTPVPTGPPVNNDDRDRLQTEIGGRLGKVVEPGKEIFLQGIYDDRNYDTSVDNFGYNKSSDGYQLAIGASGRIGNFSGEVLVGLLSQNYDDSAFETVTTYDIGLDLSWRPDPLTKLSAIVERGIEETTLEGSSGYIATTAGLRLTRRVAGNLSANTYLFVTKDDYQNVTQTDYVTQAGMGLRYYINPNVYLGGDYSYEQRSSTVASYDYDTHLISLRLGTELNPEYNENAELASIGDNGFYVGIQGGHGGLATSVDGPRGGGGLTASFGDWGFSGGVLGGYRAQSGKLVLGLELDADVSNTSWAHAGGRDFSVQKNNSIGFSGIIGFRTLNDVLLYGRGGIVGTEFETSYAVGGNSVQYTDRETGMRFGAGAEFPIDGSISGRMEYTITGYQDYDVGAPLGGGDDDNFSSTENLMRIALIYKLGQQTSSKKTPVDFSGAYLGAGVGQGLFGSENSGPRPTAAAPAFQLNVSRADNGLTGTLYAGYGEVFGKFYLGGEIEAEISGANWNIERDSASGRTYSVEKNSVVGAGLRLGYIFGDAVLVYGRVGVVNGWFDTDYTIAGANFTQSDSQTGIRYGGGVEFPISDDMHLRLDYTETNYSSYSVNYGTGVDNFDNSENQFRLGLGYQF
jgi:opacity protein-like surface antigen